MVPQDYPGPMTVDEIPRKPGQHFTTGQLARAVMRTGEADPSDAIARVRGYFQRGYLHPIGQDANDKRKPYLFNRTHALLVGLLDRAGELSVRDREFYQAIAAAAHFNDPQEAAPFFAQNINCPLSLCWAVYDANPRRTTGFTLRIQWLREMDTDGRSVRATIINDAAGLQGAMLNKVAPGWYPVADLLLPLDPLLPGIARALSIMGMEH